ncbi:MAG: hypothetical protein U0354_00825 [Candidatus Sericytochromatia bacterium]
MNKKFFVSSILLSTFLLGGIARADNVTQLIVEKMINADKKTGYILSTEVESLRNTKMKQGTFFVSKPFKVNNSLFKEGIKTYTIENFNDGLNSNIVVTDIKNNEIKRISIGRQAIKIIKSNKDNHLFVLCGGYFGSVWEIDPNINQVIRKYSTSWNPSDIALSNDGKNLYVASGKLQKFSTENDIVLEPIIPNDIRYFNSVNSLSDNNMIIGAINKSGEQVNFTIENTSLTLNNAYTQAIISPSKEQNINIEIKPISLSKDMTIVYSRNNDFLYLFSTITGKMEAIVPLDSKIDEVMMLPQLNKALVLHRLIGQVSIIDLGQDNNTQYSVFARIIDERLKDPTNTFVLDANKVYIKSDNSQEGYIDTDNLLRYTYPVVEIPLNRGKETFKIAKLAGKRYSLKNNQLFYEELNENDKTPSRKIRFNNFGSTVGGIDISSDSKLIYLTDFSKNSVYAIDTFTNKVINEFRTGSDPSEIALQGNSLYVLNKGDQTISSIDVKTGQTIGIHRLKVDNNNLSIIKIYDKEFDQILKITLAPDVENKEFIMIKAEN